MSDRENMSQAARWRQLTGGESDYGTNRSLEKREQRQRVSSARDGRESTVGLQIAAIAAGYGFVILIGLGII